MSKHMEQDEVRRVFQACCLASSSEEMDSILERECQGDTALQLAVQRLLEAECKHNAVLESSPDSLLCNFQEGDFDVTRATLFNDAAVGSSIHGFKLLQQIGEGGFGVVYMAQQTEPVRRKVALKVIKPGMDSKEVVARFEAERQALAMMDHPNVAKVLDGGTTESGRPFFVMELVHGTPITNFCDENRLSNRDRLALLGDVCRAVQHAHLKGIIHRDLKPSNVLVTMDDDRPLPKVIDFGVSKAIGQSLTDKTMFTAFGQMVGTLLYMSPEQAQLSANDVDVRSDVYSLGVLLYELLTGNTPFDRETLQKSGFDEMRRMIREVDPPRPSARIDTLRAELISTVADQRRVDSRQLSQSLQGELDWIVMKALEKDRTRRYESARAFGDDVRRYLNDEPVEACPPSTVYRLRKYTRRHRGLLILVASVAASLLIGTVASLWQWRAAVDAKLVAEASEGLAAQRAIQADREAVKAGRVTELLSELLASANPNNANGVDYSVREMLDNFSVDLTERLQDQPEVEATIRTTIGNTYARLHVYDQAEEHLRRVVQLQRDRSDSQRLAEALNDLAWLLVETNPVEAETTARKALEIHRKLQPNSDGVLRAMHIVQRALSKQERFVESDAVAEELLRIARAGPSMERPSVAETLHNLAGSKRLQGDYDAAVKLGVEAVALHRRMSGDRHPELAWALAHLSAAYLKLADYDAAEATSREAVRVFRSAYGSDHPLVCENLSQLGEIQELQGREDDAIETYRKVVPTFLKLQADNAFIDFHAQNVAEMAAFRLVELLEDRNLNAEAAAVYADVTPRTPNGFLARGQYHARNNLDQQALGDFLQAVKKHPKHSFARRALYDHCAAHNLFDEAIAAIDKFIEETPNESELGQIRTQLLREKSRAGE